jgi:prevent-host-death family protein
MTRVSVSELKANLSKYLREVKRGGEVQVLDRGVPVARLTALSVAAASGDQRRERLIRDGIVIPGSGDASAVLERPPVKVGASILEALLEDREDRRPARGRRSRGT